MVRIYPNQCFKEYFSHPNLRLDLIMESELGSHGKDISKSMFQGILFPSQFTGGINYRV